MERQGLSLLKRAIPNSDMHLSFSTFRVQVKCCMVHLFRSSCVCSFCSVCSAKQEQGLMSGETRVADDPTCN